MKLQPANIPADMQARPAWVCWDLVQREGKEKPDKVPYDPKVKDALAKSNDPATWGTFMQARAGLIRRSGVGFMFGDGWVGVDIDHCIDTETGVLSDLATQVMNTLDGYTEYSPSGTGIHIIVRGELPPGGRKNTELGLEMYSTGRFFTVTGDAIRKVAATPERTAALAAVHGLYFKEKPVTPAKPRRENAVLDEDAKIIERASRAKNGALFTTLMEGRWEGRYESQSEADIALCNLLAYWCNGDETTMDRIFRTSGLMREKWDKPRNGSTYGRDTVARASADAIDAAPPVNNHDDWFPDDVPNDAATPEKAVAKKPVGATVTLLHDYESPNEDADYYYKVGAYTMDDTGNAQRLRDLYGDSIRYSDTNKVWYCWNGRLWQEDLDRGIKRRAEQAIALMYDEMATMKPEVRDAMRKHIKRTRNAGGKKSMIEEATQLVPVLIDEMDVDHMLFNVANGTLDLATGELLQHDKSRFITKISGVEYDPAAPKPEKFLTFLSEIMGGDAELVSYVQKAIGYSLTGLTSEQCMFILYGSGANGKSTLLEVMKSLIGDYLMNAQAETVMFKERGNGSSQSSDVARLKGARVVTTVEPEDGRRLSEGLIKQLTGGDPVTCRFLYGKDFEYIPTYKIWFATNHKPQIRGTDTGIWRRIRLIPFDVTIPPEKQDRELLDKLKAELPGILNWALEGLAAWKRDGLRPPKAVAEATQEYRGEMDVIANFVDEECTVGPTLFTPALELYRAYKDWAETTGEFVLSQTKFGLRMREKGFEKVRRVNGYEYRGLRSKRAAYYHNTVRGNAYASSV